jgi:hypothetical protein
MFARPSTPLRTGFDTLAEFILSLPKGSLLGNAAILRIPEERPKGLSRRVWRILRLLIENWNDEPQRR